MLHYLMLARNLAKQLMTRKNNTDPSRVHGDDTEAEQISCTGNSGDRMSPAVSNTTQVFTFTFTVHSFSLKTAEKHVDSLTDFIQARARRCTTCP